MDEEQVRLLLMWRWLCVTSSMQLHQRSVQLEPITTSGPNYLEDEEVGLGTVEL